MERFYHIRVHEDGLDFAPVLNNGGATVHLESIPGDPLHLNMRVAYCNPKDVFCKKEGRERCKGRQPREKEIDRGPRGGVELMIDPAVEPAVQRRISLRQLPSELGAVYRTVHKRSHIKVRREVAPDYDSRLREWLPRE